MAFTTASMWWTSDQGEVPATSAPVATAGELGGCLLQMAPRRVSKYGCNSG